MMNNKVQSLYIHIPFCTHLCDYCDFPKLQYFRNFAEKYIESLIKEIESYKIKNLKTIYIGGGTPTALNDDLFEKLLSYLAKYIKTVKEYTIEVNPESLTNSKLLIAKKYGVNRISIGVETTNDKILRAINRQHTFEDVKTAIINARNNGFDNLNVDLIIGLPHVNKAQFKEDLNNLVNLGIEHISCYSLTVHPNTVFGIKGIEEPTDSFARDLYDYAENFLKEKGFIHYEISNWAKPGRESLHNLTYWKDEQYYGVGLGAAGYINGIRYKNTRNLDKYLSGNYVDEKEIVDKKDDRTYFIMLNLRTIYGIDLAEFKAKFNEDLLLTKHDEISTLVKDKLLVHDKENDRIYPTYKGMMVLDQIIVQLIEE